MNGGRAKTRFAQTSALLIAVNPFGSGGVTRGGAEEPNKKAPPKLAGPFVYRYFYLTILE
jgi:hypothetical protein